MSGPINRGPITAATDNATYLPNFTASEKLSYAQWLLYLANELAFLGNVNIRLRLRQNYVHSQLNLRRKVPNLRKVVKVRSSRTSVWVDSNFS